MPLTTHKPIQTRFDRFKSRSVKFKSRRTKSRLIKIAKIASGNF
jgi:hypothetical protein